MQRTKIVTQRQIQWDWWYERANSSVLSRPLNWSTGLEERTERGREFHVDDAVDWKDRWWWSDLYVIASAGTWFPPQILKPLVRQRLWSSVCVRNSSVCSVRLLSDDGDSEIFVPAWQVDVWLFTVACEFVEVRRVRPTSNLPEKKFLPATINLCWRTTYCVAMKS